MGVPAVGSPQRGEVSYRLLGPFEASRSRGDGLEPETLELGRPKQRAVLALLLLSRGRVVPADRLIDQVWGEAAPPSAAASLQVYVSNLRRVLRESAGSGSPIVRRADGYVLDLEPVQLDVGRFANAAERVREALEAERWEEVLELTGTALGAWGGELLEDFRDEPWRQTAADGLGELRTECREAQITALLAVQRTSPALVGAQELRADHPFRDRACWLHVIALHRAGRPIEALEEYRGHAKRLDEELGLEPGLELRKLEVAILRHDPVLAAWPRPAGWTGASRLGVPEPDGVTIDGADGDAEHVGHGLVGRERERALMDADAELARRGEGRWLVLTGPAGIGKTRLAEELGRTAAAAGGREVWARCSEEDGAPAWWPIRQIVRALGEDPDALLVPPPGVDSDQARFELYERVSAVLEGAATTGPLIVIVDDVQWADRTSARCLAHLVAATRALPLVVALTLREDEDATAIAPLLAALARSDRYRQVPVGPLGPEEVGVLAGRVAGEALDERRAEELAERTGGNPLFISEYARLPADERARGDVPLAVRSVLSRRLQGLDVATLDVLRAAAVCGEAIDVPMLVTITGTDADALADILDDAADEHVLVPARDTGGYAFAHGLLRQEVLAATPAMRRQRLHARAADALAAATDQERVSRRARHLVSALPLVEPTDVVVACTAAARLAEQRWSSDIAATWWAEALRAFDLRPDAALAPAERDGILIAQVYALARAGRGQSVLEVLDAALLDALHAGRTETVGRLAAALLRSAGAWPWPAYGEDPRPVLEQLGGLRQFVAGDPAAHVRVLATLAVGRCYDADPTVPETLSAEALQIAEQLGRPEVLADAIVGRLIAFFGITSHADEAVQLAARLEDLEHGDERLRRVDAATGRAVACMAHVARGDVAAAERAVGQAVAESELLGLPVLRVQLRWMQGSLALWRGALDEAEQHYVTARRAHAQSELYYSGEWILASNALRRAQGRLAEADGSQGPEPLAWAAAIAAARGEKAAAEEHATAWLDQLTTWTWATLGHAVLVAHACADAGAVEPAQRLEALLRPRRGLLTSIGQAGVIEPVDLALGRLRGLAGDTEAARELLDDALALSRREGGPSAAGRCEAALTSLDAAPGP